MMRSRQARLRAQNESSTNLRLKKSYHTCTAHVTNACFHVDENEEIYVDPAAEWLEQQAALGIRLLCYGD